MREPDAPAIRLSGPLTARGTRQRIGHDLLETEPIATSMNPSTYEFGGVPAGVVLDRDHRAVQLDLARAFPRNSSNYRASRAFQGCLYLGSLVSPFLSANHDAIHGVIPFRRRAYRGRKPIGGVKGFVSNARTATASAHGINMVSGGPWGST
jgi:hypothetical protein